MMQRSEGGMGMVNGLGLYAFLGDFLDIIIKILLICLIVKLLKIDFKSFFENREK